MQPPTGQPLGVRTITVNGQRLRIAIRPGDGTRPPLLLMNGIGANLELLRPFVEALDPAMEVLCFDVPGVGGSPPPAIPYRFATLAWLVARMLDVLGYAQVDVLGISWGGGLAQQFAVQYRTRCRRLVLVSTATGALMVPGRPAVLAKLTTPRRYLDPAYLARVAPELYGGSLRSHPEHVRELVQATHMVGLRGYLYQLLASIGWTSLPWLPLIRQPTLILAGDDDPIVPLINATLMQRLIPDARLRVFHDGHLGLLTQARELAPVVAQFLAEEPPPDASRSRSGGSPGRLWQIVVLIWQNLTVDTIAAKEDTMSARYEPNAAATALPAVDGDFYQIAWLLSKEDQQLLGRVRAFMETQVAPIINHYWTRAAFPFDILPGFRALGIAGTPYHGYGCPGNSTLLDGFVAMELARVDPSIATFHGVHSGLAMGSIYLCGSEEQKQRWLPPMARFEQIGAFGLTEPEVGSGAAGGLTTTAQREGDTWVLSGQKKWIGNATFADLTIIWARDLADNQVKGFVVEKGTPGFSTEKLEDKIALRVVQNALIRLDEVRVPEANRLQQASSFRDTARVLKITRANVAWQAVGCARGAYEHALAYAQRREQFGRPIGRFQLVQDLLVRMLGNITASQCMVVRLSQLQDAGMLKDEHAALAKAFCTVKMRETVGFARELLGGNGILLEEHVGRFVADAEAIYSYEGTREINTLIVGRAITGFSAFV